MIKPAKFKMAKNFDQAITDESAYDLYSSRNAKFDELNALIVEINELKYQSATTRTTKSKFIGLKTNSEELKTVWSGLDQDTLNSIGVHKGLEWNFGPADSPWYQGAAEALIKCAKKAITLAIGHQRMSAVELLTVFSEAANLMNERPIGFLPSPDSHLNILTANSLLLGRSTAINPGGYEVTSTIQSRVSLVQKVIDQFWLHWTQLYAPTLVQQSKWLSVERDLRVDDVVLVAD